MTIDDFDVNEISDKLAIREENDSSHTLEAYHDDGHQDTIIPPVHGDTTNPPWHDDDTCCGSHDDGHYDVSGFDDGFNDTHDDCSGPLLCPVSPTPTA